MHPLFHPLFIKYIVYFNDHQDYFECHEVLEEYWKEIAPSDKTHPLTAWILLATGMYHWRRDNFPGANRSLSNAQKRFALTKGSPFYDGINMSELHVRLNQSIELINNSAPFQAYTIHLDLDELQEKTKSQDMPTPLTGNELIHKHMLRDRSEILKAREEKRRNRH